MNRLVAAARANWPVLLAGAVGLVSGAVAISVAGGQQDRAAVEAVVHDYVLAHPEIIPEAMTRLREQQASAAIRSERVALEKPFAGAWTGNAKGDVTLVMFSDYACGFCKASAPDIARLIAEEPGLKVVWREIPVLGPPSEQAARIALAVAKVGDGYPAFHRALFAEPRPDAAGITAAARAAGAAPALLAAGARAPDIGREIDANLALATRLGIGGTPAFVVGDRLLAGAVGHDALRAAIEAARKG